MRVSMGGMNGMVGGGSGGMGGMDMMEDPSLWGQMTAFLDTLPPWLATIIIAAAVILGAMFIGWLAGQIIGRVIYPNPDKPSVLNKKEKMIYAGAFAVAIVLIVSMALPKSEDDMAVNGDMDGIGGDISSSVVGENPDANGSDETASSDANGSDETASSDSSSESSGENSSSAASSDSSTATPPAAPPNISVNPVAVPSLG